MKSVSPGYRALVRGVRVLLPAAALSHGKLGRSVRGRRGVVERFESWAAAHRDPALPLLWVHAPSVGEGLQARAVIEALRDEHPGAQVVFTHFSSSAEGLAAAMPVDFADYLPWDVQADVARVLAALSPSVVAFTKTEAWPVLTAVAGEMDIPCVLIAGTLPEGSTRLRWPGRSMLRPTFERLAAVAAIAEEDADRFGRLGVRAEALSVLGDPAVDSAFERAQAVDSAAPFLAPFHSDDSPWLVAGSTWESDERVLIGAVRRLREAGLTVRLLVAPHEPTPDHVAALTGRLQAAGHSVQTLSAVEATGAVDAEAVVVDRLGVLAQLYTVGQLAYVGGGFGRAGLHSVLEPAAAGIPVMHGPRYQGSRAAVELYRLGGSVAVKDSAGAEEAIRRWVGDPTLAAAAGARAFGYIEAHRGAADRTAQFLGGFLARDMKMHPK